MGEVEAHHQVEGIGSSGAHEIGYLLVDHVLAGELLQGVRGYLADAADLAMAVGVGLAVLNHLASGHVRPFADRHHGVVAGVVPLVLHHQFGEPLRVEGHFGNEGAIDTGHVGADEAGLAAVAAEELDDGDALVRAGAGAELVNELDAPGDGGAESYAVVGAVHVVVHRFGDAHDGKAFAVQTVAVAEGVVAADGDEHVDLQVLKVLQDVGRKIAGACVFRFRLGVLPVAEEIGHRLCLHLAWIGPARVKKGAAGAIDGAHRMLVKGPHIPGEAFRVVAVELQKSSPAPPYTDDFMAFLRGSVHDGLDARVQSGNIASTCQNSNFHLRRSFL